MSEVEELSREEITEMMPSTGAEMTLYYGVYRDTVAAVNISRSARVSDLQDGIFFKQRYDVKFKFASSDLTLCVAKKEGEYEWVKEDEALDNLLARGEIGKAYPKMRPSWDLLQYITDSDLGKGVIHVFVELPDQHSVGSAVAVQIRPREESIEDDTAGPAKRHRDDASGMWEWKEEEPIYSIKSSQMAFVDRERATQQLADFHKDKYDRAMQNNGKKWVVPLVDNVFGRGKSTFAKEYIRRCKQKWGNWSDDGSQECSFYATLCKCHTITINLDCDDTLDGNGKLRVDARQNMMDCIGAFFDTEYGARPRALASEMYSRYVSVLNNLTKEVGPVFIVFDEIGATFNDDNLKDLDKRDRLIEFCEKVVFPLFSMRSLFFFWLLPARFLKYVDSRSMGGGANRSPFTFERLNLTLLRRPAVEDIIVKTYWDNTKEETIQQHYNFDEHQVVVFVEHLFRTTFGHPRSLLDAGRSIGKTLLILANYCCDLLRSMIHCAIDGEGEKIGVSDLSKEKKEAVLFVMQL